MRNNLPTYLRSKGIDRIRLTDEMLAKLGISTNRWNHLINGRNSMKPKEALAIAEILNCDIKELV